MNDITYLLHVRQRLHDGLPALGHSNVVHRCKVIYAAVFVHIGTFYVHLRNVCNNLNASVVHNSSYGYSYAYDRGRSKNLARMTDNDR